MAEAAIAVQEGHRRPVVKSEILVEILQQERIMKVSDLAKKVTGEMQTTVEPRDLIAPLGYLKHQKGYVGYQGIPKAETMVVYKGNSN